VKHRYKNRDVSSNNIHLTRIVELKTMNQQCLSRYLFIQDDIIVSRQTESRRCFEEKKMMK